MCVYIYIYMYICMYMLYLCVYITQDTGVLRRWIAHFDSPKTTLTWTYLPFSACANSPGPDLAPGVLLVHGHLGLR